MTFFAVSFAADRPLPWLTAALLMVGGFVLFRLTWPVIAAAWASAELRKEWAR